MCVRCMVNVTAVSIGFAQPDPVLDTKGLYDSCWILALGT